ncbi:hypothetical protein [Alteromonas facilis]|uniref:hypothetical protein n=1 Tax=Alteromonas facilis TaxID=2048004 RepID=UPI000C28C868|nr:hypothetical protein [Alteromonas facilis]
MNNELQQLCISLYAKGIEPTTSLLRAKSQQKTSLPQAIETIKWWQNQDKAELLLKRGQEAPKTPNKAETASMSSYSHDLRVEVRSLMQRIESTEAELQALKDHLTHIQSLL